MIRIHVGVAAPPMMEATVIREPQGYIAARVAIRDALLESRDLDVFVLTRVCDNWFWDLEASPGVEIVQEDPVALLCRKLRVPALPAEIADPTMIAALNLLGFPEPPDAVSDVGAWTLGHTLDAVWSVPQPSHEHLAQLLHWFASETMPELLQPLARRRLRVWTDHGSGQLRDAYQALEENPHQTVLFLCCWKTLDVYDEQTRRQWLEEEGWYVQRLERIANTLGRLPLPFLAETSISKKAIAYWRRCLTEIEQEVGG